ncbi:MAG: hypothetical protein ABFD44_08640 [Anaerolineaceae bacterium]
MTENNKKCLVCERTSQEIPLLTLDYQDQHYFICPEHFPILIHKPSLLVGKLPGADQLKPHEE